MRRLLVVTHRSPDQDGGPAARWRSLQRRLPGHGWEADVVTAPVRASSAEFATTEASGRRVRARARVMATVGRLVDPAFALAGLKPDAMPLSMAWTPRGAAAVRARLEGGGHSVVVATGPPMVALLAARLALVGRLTPLVVELRDLWAGSPAFDRRGGVLTALERWVFARAAAIVVMTPEAARNVRERHPRHAERVVAVPNGFEPALLRRRAELVADGRRTLLHSGTLTPARPLGPLLRVLAREPFRDDFRLVLHGVLSPATRSELDEARGVELEVVAPSPWADAIDRIAAADAALVTQAEGAGDATAVASKVYEYLALGKPVLCVTDGGATEQLLRRLGANEYCARLGDEESIARALRRLIATSASPPVAPDRLEPYDRERIAERMAVVLDGAAATLSRVPPASAPDQKERVQEFWEESPCGSEHAKAPEGSREFFDEVERKRDELEPFIADYADFAGARGKRVLEIGVGAATDFIRFARAGADITGVDLTEQAVALARRRLELEGLEGQARTADAEHLPFEDGTFDHVYSWGVLHHTPQTEEAIAEALRVLRPGGDACIMLYARRSWVAWGMWLRHGPLAGRPRRSVRDVLAHHMESEGTRAFTLREARELFGTLEDLRIEHVGTPYDRAFAGPLARATGSRLGWFLVIRGRKPTA